MCTVCFDYDLCASCFQTNKTSKNHLNSHKVTHILNTLFLKPDDLVPVHDAVNPPANLAKGRKNWTLVSFPPHTPANPTKLTTTLHRLHLFDDDSHARFRSYARPGHYGIGIEIGVQFDADLNNGKNAAARQQLLRRSNGAGKLRVTMGIFKNNQQFAGARFAEDSFSDTTFPPGCLPRKLFHPGFRGSQVQMDVGVERYMLQPEGLLHVGGSEGSVAGVGIGLVVQWSGVAAYEQSKNPIVSIMVTNV